MNSNCNLTPGLPLTNMDKYWNYRNNPAPAGLYMSAPTPLWNNMVSITYPPPRCPFEPCEGVRRCPTMGNYFAPVQFVRGSYYLH